MKRPLREALTRDQAAREGIKKSDAARKVNSFIQNVHHFRDEHLRSDHAPVEKVVVFDEAQRAWSREQTSKFMSQKRGKVDFDQSEPEFLLSVMEQHVDWCVVVCLIGGGQEINTGEAGIGEWLKAFFSSSVDWDVHASSLLGQHDYIVDSESRSLLESERVSKNSSLHLSVSMRSFRAENLNKFVKAMLDGDETSSKLFLNALQEKYPVYVTRDIQSARDFLRVKSRGSERCGIVSSSGALRLRPEGIDVRNELRPEFWFLNDRDDVRSSYYLEEPATEFDVQGLELDWACVAWDADLRSVNGTWEPFKFSGTRWLNVRSETRKQYALNSYRVLLTRARQGMVIFVPKGDDRDATRLVSFYDGIAEKIKACGVCDLPACETSI